MRKKINEAGESERIESRRHPLFPIIILFKYRLKIKVRIERGYVFPVYFLKYIFLSQQNANFFPI